MNRIEVILKNCNNEQNKFETVDYTIIKGSSNIMISAPHAYNQFRNGKVKSKDKGTLTIAKVMSQLTNCHVMYTNHDLDYDPNYNKRNAYKEELTKYIKENDIKYLIDIHGMRIRTSIDVEIGTNYLKNINGDEELLNDVIHVFKECGLKKIKVDRKFKSSKRTICNYINNKNKIQTLQFEICKKYRTVKNNISSHRTIINSLIEVVYFLERRDSMEDINYIEKYDTLLDIKPSYGYKRLLGEIAYNQVGMEIEVAVNYDRNSYSFIKKMLLKIKNIVGDNGYFVKDGTILGDYSFEIVLDPLKIEDIYTIYSSLLEVMDFSNGLIEISKEKKCGIHLNFNKFDIASLEEAHKKVTSFALENKKFFDENLYKQFKFIWDYEDYYDYQKKIGDKYLWINYLKNKLVEVRNIKADIKPKELVEVITYLLQALYSDKEISIDHKSYLKLHKLYNTVLDKENSNLVLDKIHNDEFVIISLKDSKAKIVSVDDSIKDEIKKLI